ncbi:peptide/nickel transport system substrate-binding protein [Halobiforma haloterrestris]|uniref:Peptide/nickel transport system substrate-binding protein n=1 Tax=Natronobacterium haloterrestre TaxID=148448 RepID=A0A1I1G116_NATHA|nr:ABC transporter substrate-binding protein [Halobiforma haloterrestris]SFC05304.1 peptide/nickel transport system substrate-binding protein [Halobiforma haloterrestris]
MNRNALSPSSPSSLPDERVSRRSVLAAAAVATVPTSGCATRVRSVVDDGGPQLSLTLGTVPTDDDRGAIRIARHLESTLEAVGIDVTLDVRQSSEFLEAVLLDHEFDLFVGRYPVDGGPDPDPDFLYGALHSQFATEAGRQNPFGVTDMALDEALETQRRADGRERRGAVESVLAYVAERKPFEPICRPIEHRLARPEAIDGWADGWLGTELDYLGLESVGTAGDGSADRLHALLLDSRPSRNCNPLSVTMRDRDVIVDLLYDSLGAVERETGTIRPWLADRWEWESKPEPNHDGTGSPRRTTATVTLREDAHFHDGEPITAADVAFTYRFLADTALGNAPVPSPAPRYRGRVAAVDDVEVRSETELSITVDAGSEVANRIATVPILPEHVWIERLAEYGVDPDRGLEDEAENTLDTNPGLEPGYESEPDDEKAAVSAPQGRWGPVAGDVEPIGSGPYRLADRSERDGITLERYEGHFAVPSFPDESADRDGNTTATIDEDGPNDETHGRTESDGSGEDGAQSDTPTASIDELYFDIDPSSASAIQRTVAGDADLTASMLEADALDRIPAAADADGSVRRLEARSPTFYYLGFNTRRGPVGNVHFRRAVAHLIDKAWIVDDVFHGEADPIVTPVGEEWLPDAEPDLTWDGTDPVAPFPGEEGELDVEAARALFEDRGFQYDEDGRLLRRY